MASASRYLSTEDASSEIIMYDIKLNTRLLSNNYNIRRIFSLIVRSKGRGRERETCVFYRVPLLWETGKRIGMSE